MLGTVPKGPYRNHYYLRIYNNTPPQSMMSIVDWKPCQRTVVQGLPRKSSGRGAKTRAATAVRGVVKLVGTYLSIAMSWSEYVPMIYVCTGEYEGGMWPKIKST